VGVCFPWGRPSFPFSWTVFSNYMSKSAVRVCDVRRMTDRVLKLSLAATIALVELNTYLYSTSLVDTPTATFPSTLYPLCSLLPNPARGSQYKYSVLPCRFSQYPPSPTTRRVPPYPQMFLFSCRRSGETARALCLAACLNGET
jgi:hypothetical protein